MKSILLEENNKQSLDRLCSKIPDGLLDIETLRTMAMSNVRSLQVKDSEEPELLRRWYESYNDNIYSDLDYVAEAFACWSVYSKQYMKSMLNPKSLPELGGILSDIGNVKTIVDLGCGIGMTTWAWKQLYPNARVIGTNIPDTFQTKIATRIGKQEGFEILSSDEIRRTYPMKADIVFASEYFEHFQQPIIHLYYVFTNLYPRVMLIANSFSSRAIGHFESYETFDGNKISGKLYGRFFNNTMRVLGYQLVETKMWNGRPSYWRKI